MKWNGIRGMKAIKSRIALRFIQATKRIDAQILKRLVTMIWFCIGGIGLRAAAISLP